MSQKIIQTQSLQQVQTLSPQQVLLVRLLEMPVSELEQRVKNEMMDNGALEERERSAEADEHFNDESNGFDNSDDRGDEDGHSGVESYLDTPGAPSAEISQALGDYSSADDVPDYLLRSYNRKETPESIEYSDTASFYEQMKEQMGECELTEHQAVLMEYLIGSLENDGLLKKPLATLVNELEIYHNVETNRQELEEVLKKLQQFEPAGIGARSLQECLLLQIERDENYHTPLKQTEHLIIEKYYEEFTRKRWDKIQQRLKLTDDEVERLQKEIKRLNPRPGSSMGEVVGHNFQQIIPDFIAETDDNGTVTLSLNQGDVPELRISDSFLDILKQYDSTRAKSISRSEKDALQYTKQKIEKAQYFIDAIKQRRHTLLITKTLPYRIHDMPDPNKLMNLSEFIVKFGYKLKTNGTKGEVSRGLNKLLTEVRGKKEQNLIETVSLRAMMKARYSTHNIGHYGLAFDYYTHFTSPIRRYPDVMVHRLLTRYAEGGRSANREKYEELCDQSSEMEQIAANAERASIKYKQVEFMSERLGQVFEGTISGVTEFGLYVEVNENKCEGMVPLRDLDDDYYEFDERNYCLWGRKHHHRYSLGDSVKIKVARANLDKKQLDYALVKE